MRFIAGRILGKSVATWALWGSIVVVALITSLTILRTDPNTQLGVSLAYMYLEVGRIFGIRLEDISRFSNLWILVSLLWGIFCAAVFAIPAAIICVFARPLFQGKLSFLLISLWLLSFLWVFYIGPEWSGP